jgi:hypothetical protein
MKHFYRSDIIQVYYLCFTVSFIACMKQPYLKDEAIAEKDKICITVTLRAWICEEENCSLVDQGFHSYSQYIPQTARQEAVSL